MSEVRRIAICGYYGCGNAGDEAVLAGTKAAFARAAGYRVRLTALSQNPEQTRTLHGIDAAYRMSATLVRRTCQASDLLLLGGGSLLQDTTSVRSLLYYLWVARVGLHMKTPLMFWAQGIGPLHRRMSQALVRMVANRAGAITVRDLASLDLLARIGVLNPNTHVTADPAFCLSPAPPDAINALLRDEQIPADVPLLGVALRAWGGRGESPIPLYARLLDELAHQTGCRIVLLPFHTPDDMTFSRSVIACTADANRFSLVSGTYAPDVLLGLVGRMQAVVALRLHALIFAARMHTVPFALSYDPKVTHLMNGLGLGDCLIDWNGFEAEEVAARVAALLSERPARVNALAAQTSDLEARALRNAEIALTLLG